MAWQTLPVVVGLRSLGRHTGLNRLLCALAPKTEYEQRFDQELLRRVRGGDCAWDVGANRGIYTQKLLQAVGHGGQVVAFEPLQENARLLRDQFGSCTQVHIHQTALGTQDSEGTLVAGSDSLRATTRVVLETETAPIAASAEKSAIDRVSIRSADSLIGQGLVARPHVIKIDVEGFELDCLNGMRSLLGEGVVRSIGIEIHYGLLAARGQSAAPRKIEQLLAGYGYSITWTDRSHLIADLFNHGS
ncbi:MAG: FkbM family methyltransferase [Gammaproteobacteria bacterium]|nr:FkbM family methyltransferase [Gammaproteobacteria bacterium]